MSTNEQTNGSRKRFRRGDAAAASWRPRRKAVSSRSSVRDDSLPIWRNATRAKISRVMPRAVSLTSGSDSSLWGLQPAPLSTRSKIAGKPRACSITGTPYSTAMASGLQNRDWPRSTRACSPTWTTRPAHAGAWITSVIRTASGFLRPQTEATKRTAGDARKSPPGGGRAFGRRQVIGGAEQA